MTDINKAFDYIIIGGGSAGCVLANRLSADSANQVCLLEAGPPDSSPFISMPLGMIFGLRSKKLNWHFWTTPQQHCDNRSLFWPRGRTLGGSSAINAMCYSRGNPQDYDDWAALGCEGWSYADVLPYFKKLENFEPGANDYHGINGPLNIAKPVYMNPLVKTFVQASKQAGYPVVDDYNAATQEGMGYFYVMQKNGRRCSNAAAYLHSIRKRKNLTIITNAQVTKILFQDKKAIGVCFRQDKKTIQLFANKEIILSAGAINSPQILMLSGVGPRAEIEKHGIKLIHDLPGVGENLQDHLDIHLSCIEKTHTAMSFTFSGLLRLAISLFPYIFKHNGELTSNYAQGFGFIKSQPTLSVPDLQFHFAPSVYTNSGLNLTSIFKYYGYTLMTCYLHPNSRGKISLRDADPFSPPLIDANYLSDPSDLEALVIGFKKGRDILSQAAFAPYFSRELQPGKNIQSDEEIKNYIREYAETIYHPVGTCKMGTDAMSVVDPKTLKIYGLENIRVIDASVIPKIISGNTNVPTTMIAEKGADFIL